MQQQHDDSPTTGLQVEEHLALSLPAMSEASAQRIASLASAGACIIYLYGMQ